MKILLSLICFFAFTVALHGQNSAGLRFSLLLNKIYNCYNSNRQQPAAMGGYGFYYRQFSPDWGIQAELGYSQRNTRIAYSGTSHFFFYTYRLKQIEMNLIGKFAIAINWPVIMVEFGATTGYAMSGREHLTGNAIGNISINEYRAANFDNFYLKRFQFGPLIGLEIALPVFDAGEILLDCRYAYYPENKPVYYCEHPSERRLSLALGYKWNL